MPSYSVTFRALLLEYRHSILFPMEQVRCGKIKTVSKRKNTIDDFLVWAGIILVAASAILDFFMLFTANYLRNTLFTLPIWVLGFACFVIIGNREKNKKTRGKPKR